MQKKIVSFFFAVVSLLLLSAAPGQAQTVRRLGGTVVDQYGNPVAGAAVLVTGSNKYAVSGDDGYWIIEGVAADATLSVSCLGYEDATIPVNGQSFINVVLNESSIMLEETVAIGYGRMKKSDLTGSVASLSPENLATKPSNSIESLMQGRVAGVQVTNNSQEPGASSIVRVRGNSSVNGSNAPLLVVDGFPFGDAGNLAQINPQDIISMEVLKDASASAIYGSRGANGVILITTNKAAGNRTSLSVRQQTTLSQMTSKLDLWYDPVLMAITQNEAKVNAGLTPQYVGAINANGVYYPSIEELMTTWTTNTRWEDLVLRRQPVSNNTTVQVRSSNDKTNFMASANYYRDNGVFVDDYYQKFGGRFSVDQRLFKNFVLTTGANIMYSKRNYNPGRSFNRNPIFPVYHEDGSYWLYSASDYYHPIALKELSKNTTEGLSVIANAGIEWNLFDGFTVTSQLNYKHGESIQDIYNPSIYSETGNFNNGYGQIVNGKDDNLVMDIYGTYDKVLAEKHHVTAMVGYSYETYRGRSSSLTGVDFVNEALGNENLQAGNPERYRISNGLSQTKLVSGLMRLNYGYDNRYLFTFTARADGSSKFGAGNKWAYFPSGAVSWNAHNESFLKDVKWLDVLKFRASYGVSGNQGISPYQTLSRFGQHKYYYAGSWQTAIGPGYQSGYTGEGGIYAVWSGIANTNLKWETTSQLDFGVDVSLFGNRLNVTFDWYDKVTNDLLRERNIAPSSGYDRMWVNDGTIKNTGIELTLDGIMYSDRDWKVGGTFMFTRNRNRVLSLGNAIEAGLMTDKNTGMQYEYYGNSLGQFRGYTNILAIDQPMYVFYGYKVDGIVQSLEDGLTAGLTGNDAEPGEFRYVDVDESGTVDENDRCIIGDPNPDFLASLSLDVKWKNLDASIFFNGVFGNDVINTQRFGQPSNNPLRWTPDNPNNDYPKLRDDRQTKFSDWWVEDGTFIRIQTVSLGYTIPLRKSLRFMDSIRLYTNVDNLFTFTKFKGYDPEVGANGIYSGGYPRLRKWTFGIDFNF
ncbi:MAG: TonB-dependent receptor [Bacteroidales bacterium]|nr:TonB-dependent receptor [Bacteroidales bacterium]